MQPRCGKLEFVVFRDTVVPGFDRTEFEAKQIFITRKHGTQMSMFIVSKKGIALNVSHPTLLYGDGGFNIRMMSTSVLAAFVISRHLGEFVLFQILVVTVNMEKNGIKQVLLPIVFFFDDFIFFIKLLVSKGYTRPKKLCIEGGSNGGFIIATCTN